MAVLQVTIAVLLFLFVDDVAGQKSQNDPIPSHEAWTCSNTSTNTSLRLSCPDGTDWFHIVREEFSFTGNCTTGIYNNSSAQDTGSSGLSVSCLGPQTNGTCEEVVEIHRPQFQNDSEKLVKVTYECVKENLTYNICGNVSVQVGGVFYLASPDFFNQTLDNDQSELCRCVVQARSTVRTKLLYVANASSLLVSCTNCTSNSIPTSGRWINEAVLFSSDDTEIKTVGISFNAFANGSHMENSIWIQIEGEGKMNLQCNGYTGLTTEALPTSPPSPNPNTNTRQDGDVHSDGQDHTRTNTGTKVYVLGAIAGILLLAVAVIVVFVIITGRNRREAAKDTEYFSQPSQQHTECSNTHYATNMTADGYCEVDVNAGKPRILVSPLPSTDKSDSTSGKYVNGNGKENGTDQHSSENNLAQGGSESVSGAKELDDGSENTAYPHQDGQKKPAIYHILEPDPDAPQEPGLVIVPVQRKKTGAKTKDGIPTPGASSDPGEYIYLRNDDAEAGGGAEASGSSFGPRENSFHAYADVDESAVGEFSAGASFSSRPSSLHNYAEIEDAAATPAGNPDPHGDPPANKHNARRRDYGQYEEIQIKPLGQGS